MADSKIRFEISSLFKGEGFTKAADAIDKTSKSVKKGTEAFGKLSGELSALGGTAGKVVNGIGDLAAAFATGTLGITAITMAVSKCIEEFTKLQEAWKEEESAGQTLRFNADETRRAYERLQKSIASAHATELEREYGHTIEMKKAERAAVEELAKEYKVLSSAQASLSKGEGQLKIAKITEQFNAALRNAANEIDKGVIEASKRLALAQESSRQKVEAAAAATENEREAVQSLTAKIATQTDLIAALEAAEKDTTKETEALEASQLELKVQQLKLAAAEKAEEAARIEAADEEAEANAALAKVKKAAEDEAEARLEAKNKLDEQTALTANLSALQKAKEKAQTELDAVESEYKKVQEGRVKTESGVAADEQYHSGISGQGYNYSRNDEGHIDNFVDWQRAQRYAGRAERDNRTAEKQNAAAERQYNEIKAKEEKGWSLTDVEKKKKDAYEQFKNQKKSDTTWQEDIKDAADKLESLDDQITELRDELGLK